MGRSRWRKAACGELSLAARVSNASGSDVIWSPWLIHTRVERQLEGVDLAVDAQLAHAPGDELRVLRAEVEDQDHFDLGARPVLTRSARSDPTPARPPPRAPDQLPRGSRRAQA